MPALLLIHKFIENDNKRGFKPTLLYKVEQTDVGFFLFTKNTASVQFLEINKLMHMIK